MNSRSYLEDLPTADNVVRGKFARPVADGSDAEAFEALIERWRLRAFDAYCTIRKAQRENDLDASARLVALCEAANIAVALAGEIAALRAEVVFALPDESSYTVLA